MVNDMICDCCDGSDEWDTDVNCPNVCDSLGAEAREAAKKQRAVYEAGWAKRAELAKQGAKALEEKKSELGKLKKELEELQPLKSSTEETKSAAEAKEQEAKDKEDNAWNGTVVYPNSTAPMTLLQRCKKKRRRLKHESFSIVLMRTRMASKYLKRSHCTLL